MHGPVRPVLSRYLNIRYILLRFTMLDMEVIFNFPVFYDSNTSTGLQTASAMQFLHNSPSLVILRATSVLHTRRHLLIKIRVRQQLVTSFKPLCSKENICCCPAFSVQFRCFHQTLCFWKQLRKEAEKKN